jgi:hypothetical protein
VEWDNGAATVHVDGELVSTFSFLDFRDGSGLTIGALRGPMSNKPAINVYRYRMYADGTTLAEYRFDEGQGITLTDYSGNANHLTMTGATWLTKKPVRVLSAL